MTRKSKNFTICLNMIVKNESKIIINTLTNLCSKIDFDYWVICDTGSTDNTKELIQDFFKQKNINGELFQDEWVDFAHNRTLALERAFNKTDYILINDADDTINGEIVFPDNIFDYDSYYLKFGITTLYERIQLINNRKKYKYCGVLHEYIECLDEINRVTTLNGDYYINYGVFGDRSNSSDKYLKDALILETAYETAIKNNDLLHMRYSFYCANSYRDANETEKAIKWYKNTLTLNNWNQEKYISCLRLFELYETLNTPELGLHYLIEAHKYDSTRVECMFELIKFYCIEDQNDVAYMFYTLIQNYYETTSINLFKSIFDNKLFVNSYSYSFYLPYYMIIVSEKINKYDLGLKMYDIIFTMKVVDVNIYWIENLIHNLYFFYHKNQEQSFIDKWKEYFSLVKLTHPTIDTDLITKYNYLEELLTLVNHS
jgi:hypothetical protein